MQKYKVWSLSKSPFPKPQAEIREAEPLVGIILQIHGKKILRMLQDVFCWLPLATLVDEKVLVLHGGISDRTDLDLLAKLDRHKVLIHEPIEIPPLSGYIYWKINVTLHGDIRHGENVVRRLRVHSWAQGASVR